MRHSCFFAAISFIILNLSGCGMEDTGPVAHNPATDVDLTFSTFDLENTEEAPNTLEHTRFWDFYQGIQPNDSNANNLGTVKEIRDHIDRFILATRAESDNFYEKVRNPLDLINQVIASNQVTNFHEGRKYISQRIADGQSGTYNTRGNGAVIRFTDQKSVLDNAPLNEKVWIFPTLDWRYLPSGPEGSNLEEKVYRTVQYVNRSVDPEASSEQPELVSVLAGSRFSANRFRTSGYNSPEYATADYVSRNHGGIELRQEFTGNKTDTLFIKSPDKPVLDLSRHGVTPDDSSPDCLRVEVDYAGSMLRIFHSNGEPAKIDAPTTAEPDKTEKNEAYCENQENSDAAIAWATVATPDRQ